MTQEDKQLLRIDLSARLSYGVKVYVANSPRETIDYGTKGYITILTPRLYEQIGLREIKPYLRPMSSMTNNEIETYRIIIKSLLEKSVTDNVATLYNFLNSKHLDYNALIPQGLALEAPKGMYK